MLPMLKLYGKLRRTNVVHSVFYATIESRYRGTHFTVVVQEQNGNVFMVPTVVHVIMSLYDYCKDNIFPRGRGGGNVYSPPPPPPPNETLRP